MSNTAYGELCKPGTPLLLLRLLSSDHAVPCVTERRHGGLSTETRFGALLTGIQ